MEEADKNHLFGKEKHQGLKNKTNNNSEPHLAEFPPGNNLTYC